ncbi:MAG: aminotransferase class V-fold PLP-dependent enzyme [Syntrophomonadaceae bacterium]|nr:aminotransferase class V-fold PLP-dependent enzyme [Syntrophomonadaceae bacterium]
MWAIMIYLDNAAGTWPKPNEVQQAICDYLGSSGGNPGRGQYGSSTRATHRIWQARIQAARLFKTRDPGSWIFTNNTTHALNMALKGVLKPGDHVITTSMEHNSVLRPLRKMDRIGVETTLVQADVTGRIDPAKVRAQVKENTRLIAITHASNVTGAIMPVAEVAAIAKGYDLLLLVDAAQTAGVLPVYPEELGIDLLATAGHKGLYGPSGSGLLYVRPGLVMETLMEGGTGKDSDSEGQPEDGPERHEAGTLNLLGIVGLSAGMSFVEKTGLDKIRSHDKALATAFIEGLATVPRIKVYGPRAPEDRLGVVSVNLPPLAPDRVGFLLDRFYGIAVRTGLHCAPSAHRTIGTIPAGTVRFSFSFQNDLAQVETAIKALKDIASEN